MCGVAGEFICNIYLTSNQRNVLALVYTCYCEQKQIPAPAQSLFSSCRINIEGKTETRLRWELCVKSFSRVGENA
jgi:hypothetical protein